MWNFVSNMCHVCSNKKKCKNVFDDTFEYMMIFTSQLVHVYFIIFCDIK